MAPGAFLPLACTANLVKNLAAVSASTTRAPIYKTFARTNNLADVSSKVCSSDVVVPSRASLLEVLTYQRLTSSHSSQSAHLQTFSADFAEQLFLWVEQGTNQANKHG